MFQLNEEVKVISVDLPTNGKHGIIMELNKEDGEEEIYIVKIRLGGKKP